MRVFYERVSALDAADLSRGAASASGDAAVVTVLVFEGEDRPFDLAALRERVASLLHRLPRYRQRLLDVPLLGGAVWVDDEHFNLEYHVTQRRLLQTGDERELKRAVGRVASTRLDRSKPLWEMVLVEGLSQRRFALISRAHPALCERESGVDLLSLLLTRRASPKPGEAEDWSPRPAPRDLELLARELWPSLPSPARVVRELAGTVQPLEWLNAARSVFGDAPAAPGGLEGAPGPHRAVDWVAIDARSLRGLAERLASTPAEIVLTSLAGALRRLAGDRAGGSERPRTLRLFMPSSGAGARGFGVLRIPLDVDDPARRLDRVRVELRKLPPGGTAPTASRPDADVGPWRTSGEIALAAQAWLSGDGRSRGPELAVSPGHVASEVLYLGQAKLVRAHPLPPLPPQGKLALGWIECGKSFGFGFAADWSLAGSLPLLTDAFIAGFDALKKTGEDAPRRPRRKRSPRASASA